MKIVLISEYNRFTSIGGTEYYVDTLLKGLVEEGCQVSLITKGKHSREVLREEVKESGGSYTIFFLPAVMYRKEEIRQKVVSSSWKSINTILEEQKPDLIHVHTSTTFFHAMHLELCAKKFRHILFTSHIPGHFCPKGDLIKNNRIPCEGKIGLKCSSCLFTKSLKAGLSNLVFQHYQKPLQALHRMHKQNIKIICTAEWQREQLLANGYRECRIDVVRQVLTTAKQQKKKALEKKEKYSIGYLGRLSPEKGSRLLRQIIKESTFSTNIRFVLAIPRNSDPLEWQKLQEEISGKTRSIEVIVLNNIDDTNKQDFFNQIDCLLIPSFCIETGPIVLLEAVFHQKKVIAPAIGGPLEFQLEYPQNVYTYSWNNASAAIEKIEQCRKEKGPELAEYHSHFAAKEKQFIRQHLAIYQEELATL